MVEPHESTSGSLTDTPAIADTADTADTEVFSAESEAQICRMVMGLKAHGIEQLIRPL